MELRQIEAFVTVATLRSFRAAANRLHVTQPAVSLRVAALEEEIGEKLLNREGGGTTLTQRGVELLELGQQLLNTASLMTKKGEYAAPRPRIRIGATPTIVSAWLTEVLSRIRQRLPHRTFDLVVDTTRQLRPSLIEGKFDVTIMSGPTYTSGIRNIPLISYGSDWIASRRLNLPDSMSLSELARYPLITYKHDSGTYGDIEHAFREAGIWPIEVNCANSSEAILRFVERGLGIGIISSACLRGGMYSELLKVINTGADFPSYEYFASYHLDSGSHIGQIISEIARELCTEMQKDGFELPSTKGQPESSDISQAMFTRNVMR
jgi:DNA-binding transcriptional LysR family regulator